jgi:hypothetical protein
MTNRFGVDLHPKEVRWAAAEGVSEDVIAAVLLLHERSVDEIAPRLSAPELEQVINLVDRNPRLYPPGIDIPKMSASVNGGAHDHAGGAADAELARSLSNCRR